MTFRAMDSSSWQRPATNIALTVVSTALILLTISPLYYPSIYYPSILPNSSRPPPPPSLPVVRHATNPISIPQPEKCDLFTGEWIRNPEGPYYTNLTCWAIHEHQNCMKYGRPDTDYLKWRWKPDGCELPVLNPWQFLEISRDKSMAFVGDSVARNQMQSLICLLSRVEYPEDVSSDPVGKSTRWRYTTYNFTIANLWSTHLVRSEERDPNGPTSTGLFNLYLDEVDTKWATGLEEFNYVVLSAGHWFSRPMVYYDKQRVIGCHYCLINNVTDLRHHYGYRMAFRTALKAINNMESFKGVVYLRTFAPSHFENGLWNQGGNCVRTRPFKRKEAVLSEDHKEFYRSQVEEFRQAEKEARKRGKRFRLLDTTLATMMRPDGHPSRYGHWPHENVTLYNDCVHWCLPGPIDAWNDFLLEMMKMEGLRSAEEERHTSES